MPGTLHIFRLKADPLQYQVNYNLGAHSYVQVFEPERLEEFLRLGAALPDDEIQDMMAELRKDGHTTETQCGHRRKPPRRNGLRRIAQRRVNPQGS